MYVHLCVCVFVVPYVERSWTSAQLLALARTLNCKGMSQWSQIWIKDTWMSSDLLKERREKKKTLNMWTNSLAHSFLICSSVGCSRLHTHFFIYIYTCIHPLDTNECGNNRGSDFSFNRRDAVLLFYKNDSKQTKGMALRIFIHIHIQRIIPWCVLKRIWCTYTKSPFTPFVSA